MSLPAEARDRLAGEIARLEAEPGALAPIFTAAARRVGRGPTDPGDVTGLRSPRIEDLARAELLTSWARRATDPDSVLAAVADLYRHGDGDERRGVLRALHRLGIADRATGLTADALRTNDPRLVAAAMGPYATAHLDAATWRHGVLKCLFLGVPLVAVDGLATRRDRELDRMVTAFIAERRAAGREVPEDAVALLPSRPHLDQE